MLRAVAEGGTTMLAVCSEAPEGALLIRTKDADDTKEGAVDAYAEAGSA
jgi:hypothetical protein